MKKTSLPSWWSAGMSMAMLGFEAQMVIAKRMAVLAAGGPKANREAQRMVTEKVAAAGEAMAQIATGASQGKVVNGYRRKVRANIRRLSK